MGAQDIRDSLGKNIKFFRFRKQLSQADLAEKAGISNTFLSNIERGLKFPHVETHANHALGLDVDVWQLFRGEDAVAGNSRELLDSFSEDMQKNVAQTMNEVYQQYVRKMG
jgi:transcriptional regulator with XRE-family HTH domain